MRWLLPAVVLLVPFGDVSALDRPSRTTTLLAHSKGIQRCYERALTQMPGVRGKLVLRIELEASGTVREVTVTRSTLRMPSMEHCVKRAVARIRFPPGAGAEAFTVPLLFTVPG